MIENDVFWVSNLTLGEIVAIDSIIEEFAHQLLLVTTYDPKYLFLYYWIESSSFFFLWFSIILSFSR